MNDVDDETWIKISPIIVSLFQRNKEATLWNKHWVTWQYVYNKQAIYFNCHICDKSFRVTANDYLIQSVRQHGILHLKEHNLLPFI